MKILKALAKLIAWPIESKSSVWSCSILSTMGTSLATNVDCFLNIFCCLVRHESADQLAAERAVDQV
jgi:hypothetical protein